MNKHFKYLVDEDSANFFQKVSEEEASSLVKAAMAGAPRRQFQKQASSLSPFEKVASRVDRDLGMIKMAGPIGFQMGMVKRAGAYFDRILDEVDFSDDEFSELFDKIAGEAIHIDLEAARQDLYKMAAPEYHRWIDSQLADIGRDLVAGAMMEKEAFFGLGARAAISGASRLFGRGAAVTGKGALEVGKHTVTGPLVVARDAAKSVGNLVSRGAGNVKKRLAVRAGVARDARAAKAMKGLEGTRAQLAKAQAMKPGAFREGAVASLEKQVASGQSRAADLAQKSLAKKNLVRPGKPEVVRLSSGAGPAQKNVAARSEKAITDATAGQRGAAQSASQAARGGGAKTDKEWLDRIDLSAGKGKATKGAYDNIDLPGSIGKGTKPPVGASTPAVANPGAAATNAAKPPPALTDMKPGDVAQMNAAAGKDATLGEAWSKFNDTGWKSLSKAEKDKLKMTAAGGLAGYRVLTGHGAVTGGQGLV